MQHFTGSALLRRLASRVPFAVLCGTAVAGDLNLATGAWASASSARPGSGAEKTVDGVVADASRWLATEADRAPWIELAFPKPVDIGVVNIFSGYQGGDALDAFKLSLKRAGKWEIAAEVKDNADAAKRLAISAKGVEGLRLSLTVPGAARIREIAVYGDASASPGTGLKGDRLAQAAVARDVHQIAVNETGYETGRPKRFTAPLSPDGTAFILRPAAGGEALFRSTIRGGVGDFTEFQPADSAVEYVIEVSGGSLKPGTSDPFLIRPGLWKDLFWQPAVDFLIDSRSVTGTHPSAYGGCPWRDGTYYDAILPALVMLQRADPARIAAMPRQIDWEADKKRVLDPAFKFDANNPCSEGVMDAVKRYYTELEPPAADAPDVVKLIHWGAGYYLMNPATKDPSGDPDPREIHPQTVEQVAYVVWAWPQLEKWLPRSFYEKCRNFCVENWNGSLGIGKWWEPSTYLTVEQISGKNPMGGLLHPYKGRHAPGHSIVPNLLMHEVAKRDQLADPDHYLKAAVAQADWIVKNLDWSDPRTTKGQRMSEHRTIPNLVWLLQNYPDQAPPGLKAKITEWAKVAAQRADNPWDIRRYDDAENWTIPKLNDVGNWAATPAITIAASWVIDDPALKARMQQMAVSHADALFGRNPRLAAAPHHPDDFTGIERGWPKGHPDNVCARLELCRGSISSGPGSEMFPFNPEGTYRHAEGWVNYGAAWCISLAWLEFDREGGQAPGR